MKIIITEWALDAYLNLKSKHVFDSKDYRTIIRPDVMLLKRYPNDPKFSQGKFWSMAQGLDGKIIVNGFKMKWHQIGSGRVQLRATVGIFYNECFLCGAYVKNDEKKDKKQLAQFKILLKLIRQNRYIVRGRLS